MSLDCLNPLHPLLSVTYFVARQVTKIHQSIERKWCKKGAKGWYNLPFGFVRELSFAERGHIRATQRRGRGRRRGGNNSSSRFAEARPAWNGDDAAAQTTDTATAAADDDAEPLECVICLERIERHERAALLPCGHFSFHARCCRAWLERKPSCPLCRCAWG